MQSILEIVLWRMVKLRKFLIKNTSHFIVLLIKMMSGTIEMYRLR